MSEWGANEKDLYRSTLYIEIYSSGDTDIIAWMILLLPLSTLQLLQPAKGERVWVSFCVHDEKEGWLEFYENRRSAFSHNPLQRTSLSRCLHVSPSIRVHEDNEHVFAITLEGEVIKLGAQTRYIFFFFYYMVNFTAS